MTDEKRRRALETCVKVCRLASADSASDGERAAARARADEISERWAFTDAEFDAEVARQQEQSEPFLTRLRRKQAQEAERAARARPAAGFQGANKMPLGRAHVVIVGHEATYMEGGSGWIVWGQAS